MSIEANEYVVDEANVELLANWLDACLWSREDATLLFLDIDPDSVKQECFSTFSGHGEVKYYYYDDDDPYSIMEYGHDEDDKPIYLDGEQWNLWCKTKRSCNKIAKSINFYDSAEPHEWIELAQKKGITIPWLDWAIKSGLYGQKTEPDAVPKAVLSAPVVELTVSEPRPAATGPRFTVKKAAMVEQHLHEWPTIEQDIKGAHRNGLVQAKAGAREWKEDVAMEWARAKGKLIGIDKPQQILNDAINNMASTTISKKHMLKG